MTRDTEIGRFRFGNRDAGRFHAGPWIVTAGVAVRVETIDADGGGVGLEGGTCAEAGADAEGGATTGAGADAEAGAAEGGDSSADTWFILVLGRSEPVE